MLYLFLIAAFSLSGVLGGSGCPNRRFIYPCTCINIPEGKIFTTTVVSCYRLTDSKDLEAIFNALKSIEIDRFVLYDSFWNAGITESSARQSFPHDWLTHWRVKEYDVIDTSLSSSFACQSTIRCRNDVTRKFSVVNSSLSEIRTLCDTGRDNKYSWTSCMSEIKHFQFSHGKLTTLKESFFPQSMGNLQVLNFTHNQISHIEKKAFNNLPAIISLDLSHNVIQNIERIFDVQQKNLKFLDLSWNIITTIGPNFFLSLPSLASLNADHNMLNGMIENDWKKMPATLKRISLRDNPIVCDCGMRWINTTLSSKTQLLGHCTEGDKKISLRTKASWLVKSCKNV